MAFELLALKTCDTNAIVVPVAPKVEVTDVPSENAPLGGYTIVPKNFFVSPTMLGNRKKHLIECFFIV